MDFFIFWGKGEKGRDLEEVNVNWGFIGVSVGIVAFLKRNRVRSLAYRWEVECAKMALLPIGYDDRRERGSYTRWGGKSGIWRFYRRVWKKFFYE